MKYLQTALLEFLHELDYEHYDKHIDEDHEYIKETETKQFVHGDLNLGNILLVCFFLYSLGFGYRENIPTYMLALQLYYMISYTCVCFFSVYLKKSRSAIFALIFFFNLRSAIIVRVTSWNIQQ